MQMAHVVSERATCPRRHVGAILVKNKKIMGTGYNGSPAGLPDCYEAGCEIEHYEENGEKKERCIRTIHAEVNLILFTDRIEREGGTVYVTDSPCYTCAKMLANSGIVEVVYDRPYTKDLAKVTELFKLANIKFRQFKTDKLRTEQIEDDNIGLVLPQIEK